jgi:hypothetical protein
VRNVGGRTCALPGAPSVVLLRDGKALPTHATRDRRRPPATAVLRQGGTATFEIVWHNPGAEEPDLTRCQPESTHVRLIPPGRKGSLTVAAAIHTCHGDLGLTPLTLAG